MFIGLFVKAIDCETMHFFSLTVGGIYVNCSATATWAHEYMAIFLFTGLAHRGVLNELEVRDFFKTWSACQ